MVGVRQFNEDEVLGRALEVFWRKGLQSTSMLDIAEVTGVLRGSLYNAYGSKERLFELAFDGYASRFLSCAEEALDRQSAEQALSSFFRVAIANMTAGDPARGCLTTRTATEANLPSSICRRLRALLDELERIVVEALSRRSVRAGLKLEPRDAARLVVTFTRGLAVIERVYQDPQRLAQTARALVRALVHGSKSSRKSSNPLR